MNITITRSLQRPGTIDGQISIYGRHICDCEENAATALPPGTYPVTLVNCHQYARKMPVVRLSSLPPCSSCPRRPFVGSNTRLPLVCPMLKPGNGVCQRTDGSIIVGLYQCGEQVGSDNIAGHSSVGGMAHGNCMTWGMIAAESAVANAVK